MLIGRKIRNEPKRSFLVGYLYNLLSGPEKQMGKQFKIKKRL